ncbi:MAG: response regulator transcription factor [Rikenella sp.]|nr:response regulator transcription factor [Rikenella sp.]
MNGSTKKARRVVVVGPSAIIRAGLKSLLADSGSGEFEVCGTFDDPERFTERAPILNPDLVLIDPVVFDFHRRTALRTYFEELPRAVWVAVVYGFVEPEVLKQYHGSVLIYDDGRKIVRKLRQAMEARRLEAEPVSEGYELTDRESEILVSVAKGMTNKEIADAHHISVHTVISHRKNITRKTGIKTVSGLTVYALLNNLIDQSEVE